jgi:hypothetical protein
VVRPQNWTAFLQRSLKLVGLAPSPERLLGLTVTSFLSFLNRNQSSERLVLGCKITRFHISPHPLLSAWEIGGSMLQPPVISGFGGDSM